MKILVWEVRTKKDFTLMKLSQESGVPRSTINDIENERFSPTLAQIEKLAIALKVRMSDLYESEYK